MVKDVEGSDNRPSLGTVRVLPGVTEENNAWPYWRWRSLRTMFV